MGSHRFDLGDGDTVRLSCSVGFTFFPFQTDAPNLFTWEQVLDLADRALYKAKQAGRDQWVGVLSMPGADPMMVMRHKDDDLDEMARNGIIELQTPDASPPDPDSASDGPRLIAKAG